MKNLKKILSLTLAFVLCLSLAAPSFAASESANEEVVLSQTVESEYEAALKKTEELQKSAATFSADSDPTPIDEYKTAFDKRVQLSESVLFKMGYSKEDIKLMKAYANGNVSFAQAAAITSAELTTRFICSSHTSTQYIFNYEWSWDRVAMAEGNDSCAIGVVGINSNSMAMVSTITSASSSITYVYSDGTTYQSSSIATTKSGEGAYSSFATYKINSTGDRWVWAKNGSIRVVVTPAVSGGAFAAVRVAGEYGHSTSSSNTSLTATITVNPSASTITFTFKLASNGSTSKIEKLGYRQSIYKNDGSVIQESP